MDKITKFIYEHLIRLIISSLKELELIKDFKDIDIRGYVNLPFFLSELTDT